MTDLQKVATDNLEQRIRSNPYPGRGIILGMDESGDHLVQVYWIMGRSASSRNRVFSVDGGDVWTEAADPSTLLVAPELIIYNAMREMAGLHIVTNGDQTDTVFQTFAHGGTFEQALATRMHESDAPNNTPRISGVFDTRSGTPIARMSVLKASLFGADASVRQYFHFDKFAPGLGHCVTTYRGDGNPLPPFEGEPYLLSLIGDIDAIADGIWEALDEDNKVSMAVKTIASLSGTSRVVLRNKYEKVV